MSNKVYDIINKTQRWLPSLGLFVLAICSIWNLPFGEQINNTIIAVASLLAATLEVATYKYLKDKEAENDKDGI